MKFIADSRLTHTENDLLWDGENYHEEYEPVEGTFSLTKQALEELVSLYHLSVSSFPPERFKKVYGSLARGINVKVPWRLCMPSEVFKKALTSYLSEIDHVLSNLDLTYYFKTFKDASHVFESLKPVVVDEEGHYNLLKRDQSVVVKAFDNCGTSYDRTSSVSGRLTGHPILLLKKEYRKELFRSRFGSDGELVGLDYQSLEPRVALAIHRKMAVKGVSGRLPVRGVWEDRKEEDSLDEADLYTSLKKELFEDQSYDRTTIKQVVLSELYGAGDDYLFSKLPDLSKSDIQYLRSEIDTAFGINELKNYLFKMYDENDRRYITNYYGRPVDVTEAKPYMFVNRYIQSTAVEVATLGFSNITRYIESMDLQELIVPVLIIHDELVLDVHKDARKYIPTLCKIGSMDIDGFEDMSIRFYLSSSSFINS